MTLDTLSNNEIQSHLQDDLSRRTFICIEPSTTSTNDDAKELIRSYYARPSENSEELSADGQKLLFFDSHNDTRKNIIPILEEPGRRAYAAIVAEKQTKGHGRRGRSFISPDTGLYMSLVINTRSLSISSSEQCSLTEITCRAAVAAAKAIEKSLKAVAHSNHEANVKAKNVSIKWVNDVCINGKKVCGILTERPVQQGNLAVVGIGINVYKPQNGFSETLKNKATYILENRQKDFKNYLVGGFLNNFDSIVSMSHTDALNQYTAKLELLNKPILVIEPNGNHYEATAKSIQDDYSLVVETGTNRKIVLYDGEVSIRPNKAKSGSAQRGEL